ncbi:hypothetical protein GCM10011385_10170 [Nitratireductor aestuarii]|uniref:Uncharacterized protein n=1 Tax=Nitratireductor aestuarii TaxID=1735103 RepID=A0A916RKA0_9HYPH|nr:hypothetical protein [Nitratireductor aestuarii]GGA58494.1 hypothetical protein GCM10011385_10170 [Nitratireductor aestuarii]
MNFSIVHPLSAIGRQIVPVIAVALIAMSLGRFPVVAQGLESEGAIDAIIGSDVKTDEVSKEGDIDRVAKAIANSRKSAEFARKAYNIDSLEIVFVPEVDENLAKVLEENEADITLLRESIEGSAIFYHAIDSRSIMLTNIIAAEFDEGNEVVIFVKGTSDTADRNIETPAVEPEGSGPAE